MTIASLSDEKILTVAKSLPVAPQIMARLHKLLLDPDSGLPEIASLLKLDIALTTRIIRIANSPAYNGNGLGTIEEALQRVGFSEVFRLVGVVANSCLAESNLTYYGYTGDEFSTHNLFTALTSERIALKTGTDHRLAYTIGLLRDIGQILLNRIAKDTVPPAESFKAVGGDLLDWERRHFGVTHLDVGRVVLSHWGFPELVVKTASVDFTTDTKPTPLTQTLALALAITRTSGYGLEDKNSSQEITDEELEPTGLTHEDVGQIREQALAALACLKNN